MSQIITKRSRLSRRRFLRGATAAGAAVRIGLPPLVSMFNATGTAYAAGAEGGAAPLETRFVFWFNGNGIPERYWMPEGTGADFALSPCL
ncbi:MAG: twin-arginine translocation signal domain-containing protein, partial [Acidobacteriota bacterium]